MSMEEMKWFFDRLANEKPFAFARFNDGEMMGIDRVGSVVARGDQKVDLTLSLALKEALSYRQKDYFVGIPCSLCYPKYNAIAKDIVGDYENVVKAVVTTNRNWKMFIENFPIALNKKSITWISGEDQVVLNLQSIGIYVEKHVKVRRKNSWTFYDNLYKQCKSLFKPGDVVCISLGPTARVLVRQWFQEFPNTTFIDVGSNFDPYTRGVMHRCHRGWKETGFNLTKRCSECN